MISITILKKQYQDIFNVNEIKKQKQTRSRCQIQHAGGLTRQEDQNLIIPSAALVEQSVIQPSEPAVSGPRPHSGASQQCSNCNLPGHKRTRCPQSSHYLSPRRMEYYDNYWASFVRRLKILLSTPGYVTYVAVADPPDDIEGLAGQVQERGDKVVGYAAWVREGTSPAARKWKRNNE
ncbi:hypothetical protein PAAG_08794 [Paracoccidioides lutzii Pb01]|uniref:CCHC-type domain-containing protein n=1 Tax=Paracoccidioides lutzii (strain ATCC MYA-826 / Pb01) TaxID=502779 RepID=C1HDF3_PARBA|nr:hypothetical protein PAAG_08794 [Paracoccidioides lutzii Pb01]EEH39525.2 hypothetical protein PAAG_08794 [Paracoccidioides lutzii Pb01]